MDNSLELELKTEDDNELLCNVINGFLLNIPYRCFNHDTFDFIASNQKLILERTIFHQLNQRFSVKKSYQRSFLKAIINEMETKGIEVEEELYQTYLQLVGSKAKEETHYIHYSMGSSYISVKQNPSIISNGTTGLCVWQAGVALARYCINNKNLFSNKRILELGCGLGLTGLAVILECIPFQYCFTDNHNKVLKYLIDNIHLNLDGVSSSGLDLGEEIVFDGHHKTSKVLVMKNAWEDTTRSEFFKSWKPDVLLAADVIYDSTVFDALIRTIHYFLDTNKEAYAILSCTIRNDLTLNEFFKCLRQFNLEEELLHSVEAWNSSYSSTCEVNIYSIRLLRDVREDPEIVNPYEPVTK